MPLYFITCNEFDRFWVCVLTTLQLTYNIKHLCTPHWCLHNALNKIIMKNLQNEFLVYSFSYQADICFVKFISIFQLSTIWLSSIELDWFNWTQLVVSFVQFLCYFNCFQLNSAHLIQLNSTNLPFNINFLFVLIMLCCALKKSTPLKISRDRHGNPNSIIT